MDVEVFGREVIEDLIWAPSPSQHIYKPANLPLLNASITSSQFFTDKVATVDYADNKNQTIYSKVL